LPARYVPPSGFGHPLDGLLPSDPCRVCFTPAALLGFTLRSFPLSRGIRASPSERTHLPFYRTIFPPPKQRAGSRDRGSWASTLLRIPGGHHVFSATPTGCSLGFRPSRAYQKEPCSGFHPNSSHVLYKANSKAEGSPAPQSINRLLLGPVRPQRKAPLTDKTALLGFLRLFAPRHTRQPTSGLCVHLTPRRTLLPTDRRS
jgi:hypothetical protein